VNRKPDGQRIGIEQGAGRDHARRADVLFFPARPGAIADEREQVIAERLPRVPELFIGYLEDSIPQRRVVVPVVPAGIEVIVEQPLHFGR
jgi:hypothetical protein